MSSYDLAIAYRIYPKMAKPAIGLPFSDDKLKLSEICLRSLKKSLGGLHIKLWVLLDGCPEEYAKIFKKYFDATDLVLLPLAGIGNQATFGKQIDILLEQKDTEFVYFAEDDYFYLPDRFPRMLDFLRAYEDVHFVTPYDHPDCYREMIHDHPKWVRVYGGHHWRTAASTCLTFLTRRESLRRYKSIFKTYCWRNHDCSLWLSLTKKSLFNPVQFCRLARQEPHFAKMIAKAWLYSWPQIFFGRRMKLWVPIPGIATHLNISGLSPTIDWVTLMKQEAEASTDGARWAMAREQTRPPAMIAS